MKSSRLGFLLRAGFAADPLRATMSSILTVVVYLSTPLIGFWVGSLVDEIRRNGSPRLSVFGLATTVTFSIALLLVAAKIRLALEERTGFYLETQIMNLCSKLPGLEHFERPDFRDRLELLIQEHFRLGQGAGAVVLGLGIAAQAIATGGLLAKVHLLLLLLPLFGIPVVMAGSRAQSRIIRAQETTAPSLRRSQHLMEIATNASTVKEIKSSVAEQEVVQRQEQEWKKAHDVTVRESEVGAVFNVLAWILFSMAYVAGIGFVAVRAVNGLASPGDVLLVTILATQVNASLTGTIGMITTLQPQIRVADRYLWLLDYFQSTRARAGRSHRRIPVSFATGLQFENVTFAYPGTDTLVLQNLSLSIPPGSTVGVVGENGSGKTTLMKLVCRFYETSSGRILIDGVDLRLLDLDEWRASLAVCFQDYCNFELIVRETVGVGDLAEIANLASVTNAIRDANAYDVLKQMPQGLETQLGTTWGGTNLSVGQWQKLALSRSLMRLEPLILILDEPTASLDAATEHAVFQHFSEISKRQSRRRGITFLISHRFTTLRMVDTIIVLANGDIAEVGSHEDLMQRQGIYAELYSLQASGYQ